MSLEFTQIPSISMDVILGDYKKLRINKIWTTQYKRIAINQFVFSYEEMMFPLDQLDYSENKEALEWYCNVLQKIDPRNKYSEWHLLGLRESLRKSRLETFIMCKLKFVWAKAVEPFPEGDKYTKLYDLYAEEKDEAAKKELGKMVMIAQKKWDMSYGLFPAACEIEQYKRYIEKLISVV